MEWLSAVLEDERRREAVEEVLGCASTEELGVL